MSTISVLMAVYKEPISWVKESVNSILDQTFSDFEFLICLDNPDYLEMKDYLKTISTFDSRVRVIYNEENIGLTKSLNVLLKEAKGRYIARMDADDISYFNRFQVQFDFMEANKEISVVGSGIRRFGNDVKVVMYEDNPVDIYQNFTCHNPYLSPIAHPTAFIRHDILVSYDLKYNELYRTAQDYALWNDILKIGKISNINEVLLDYRESDQQVTKRSKSDQHNVVLSVIYDHTKFFVENKLSISLDHGRFNVETIKIIADNEQDVDVRRKLYKIIYSICYFDNSVSFVNVLKCFLFSKNANLLDLESRRRIIKKRIKLSLQCLQN